MNRRTNEISGWVEFPVADPSWKNTNEGGMFVKLVVVEGDSDFAQCCGASLHDMLQESFIADDQNPKKVYEGNDVIAQLDFEKENDPILHHFPRFYEENGNIYQRFSSVPYLASMVIGTTGWSGWSDAKEEYWHCEYENLNEKGRVLYNQLKALYAGCKLHLLTFLDT